MDGRRAARAGAVLRPTAMDRASAADAGAVLRRTAAAASGARAARFFGLFAERGFVGRRRDVRFIQRHFHRYQPAGVRPERARLDLLCEPVEDHVREEFGGRVLAGEARLLVEVAVVELREHHMQDLARAADVDYDAVLVELAAPEIDVDDVSRPVQVLSGTECLPPEAVRDHEVSPNSYVEHPLFPPPRQGYLIR